ncbi:MAG: HAMP domain-containing histidine kinase [Spirochaetes bacterium]|nr:HAMP domain-containing histidine kinase [Spirochaetota bacterium]
MRIKKLYIKIFLLFVSLLLISMILISVIFELFIERPSQERRSKYFNETAFLFRDLIEDKIRMRPDFDIADNPELEKLLVRISKNYNLKIWIKLADGKIISFYKGDIPEISDENLINTDGFSYIIDDGTLFSNRGFFCIKIPFKFSTVNNGYIYAYHNIQHFLNILPFIISLVIIGFSIALLLYPFSKYLTKPLIELKEATNNIAKGNFSQKVNIKSKDEIGELAKSFNIMTGIIESMIKGTRELTANISHEMRSPLARIRIAEEILARKVSMNNYDINKYLKSIENEIEEMDVLLGKVLQLTKLDMRETEKKENIYVVDLLKEIVEKYRTVFENKLIDVIFRNIEGQYTTLGLTEDIKTAFSNVVDNAAKYTDRGGKVNIDINKKNETIELIISNTCKKLNDDELLNIFRPFYRVPSNDSIPGTGLGLVIIKKIVENHNGSIDVKNISDGLELKLTFPIR